MAGDKLVLLQQAVALTEAMLRDAEAENWSQLATQQEQRDALLATVFPLAEGEHSEAYRPLILSMIDTNQKLESVCRQAQQSLRLELQGLNKNRKAVAAYQSS
jgi:hypothetical protein